MSHRSRVLSFIEGHPTFDVECLGVTRDFQKNFICKSLCISILSLRVRSFHCGAFRLIERPDELMWIDVEDKHENSNRAGTADGQYFSLSDFNIQHSRDHRRNSCSAHRRKDSQQVKLTGIRYWLVS